MANNWWEITIFCEPALEDLIFWRLDNFGCRGTSSQEKGQSCLICAYIPSMQVQLLDLAALSLWLRQDALCAEMSLPIVQWRLIDEEDWATNWKKHWQPQEIGDCLLIYPAWMAIPEQPDRIILRLDPGMAFGTGTHATTQLCLEALEMRLGGDIPNNLIVADIGCGSGILGIASLLLGADKVYAVDTDPLAVIATRSNRELNQLDGDRLIVEKGDVDTLELMLDNPVDGIVCNILAEVIIDIIPQLNPLIKPKTWGIFSGILFEQVKPIADTLEQHGWLIAALWKREEWCCFNVRRP